MSGSPEHYKGQYASLKFPAYKYQEYPKVLYRDEDKRTVLGLANNAMEEKELYASIGVEKSDIDPMGAALDEISVLRAKLAQYEGSDLEKQIAPKPAGKQTQTVQMLPEDAPATAEPPVAKPSNPLLKPHAPVVPGKPGEVGTAPKVDKPLAPGV